MASLIQTSTVGAEPRIAGRERQDVARTFPAGLVGDVRGAMVGVSGNGFADHGCALPPRVRSIRMRSIVRRADQVSGSA